KVLSGVLTPGFNFPEAWPMHSCISVWRLSDRAPCFFNRAKTFLSFTNSSKKPLLALLSLYAFTILFNETDFDPCSLRIQSELGRLTPMGVEGAESPDSRMTLMPVAVMPFTFSFLCSFIKGELSSNHWASLAIF